MFSRMFRNKNVFVTGHTGFKGSWLCLWLHALGAKVTGYALEPPTDPSLFNICRIRELVSSIIGDIRDLESLSSAMEEASPEIVIHLAAQPIVRESYHNPVETYAVNIMGVRSMFWKRSGKFPASKRSSTLRLTSATKIVNGFGVIGKTSISAVTTLIQAARPALNWSLLPTVALILAQRRSKTGKMIRIPASPRPGPETSSAVETGGKTALFPIASEPWLLAKHCTSGALMPSGLGNT